MNNVGLMMPLRMVLVTEPPANITPKVSKIAAAINACFRVNALEPTEVPMALATSLAPMPQAMINPKVQASTK